MTSLAEWLRADPGLAERLELIDNLCRALQAFRERNPGVRPALDPSRITLTPDLLVTLGAADPGERGAQVPEYRAPETVAGAPYQATADTYAAGVVCYEVLAGRHPFVMPTPLGSVEAASNVPPTPLDEARRDVPRDVAEAVMPCLERDPEWRPKDLSYLAETLRRARRLVPAAPRRRAAVRAAVALDKRDAPLGARARPALGAPGRVPMFAAAGAGLVLLLGGLWFLTRPAQHAPAPTVAPTTPAPAGVMQPASAPDDPRRAPAAPELSSPSDASTQPAQPAPAAPEVRPTVAPSATRAPTAASPVASPAPERADAGTPVRSPTPAPTVLPAASPAPRLALPAANPAARSEPSRPDGVPAGATRSAAAGGEDALGATPAPTPPASAPAPPPVVTTLVPARLRRGATTLVDVRGSGLRAEHRPRILYKGREAAAGVQPVAQRLVDATLLKVMIKVDAEAREGGYTLALADAQGNVSNSRTFEVGR